ncbi:MAG TPA: hypothetical protein VGX25_32250 [Actinophytocola sp.]|uniref:hypothetical protein n=1 Tax=Actinophytocola sp. TaxID=1872138 RepID=UPI002DDD6A84|nr:hypothetical protein [Actinophytocola sp.]HEV2784084.1 hypothetical protein [Actinophytocola sp.]
MLTALFLLSLIAIALWKPLLRVLLAALLAVVVFAVIQIAHVLEEITAQPADQVVESVQGNAVDDRSG